MKKVNKSYFLSWFQPDFSNTSSELDSPSHHDISLISGNHSLFEGGVGLVRHDRLLTDCQDLISSTGLPMTTVKSEVQEHSYSSVVGSDGDSIPDSPLSCTNETGELFLSWALFENHSKCRIWIMEFSTNFCPIKTDLLQAFKNRWHWGSILVNFCRLNL